jgi:hypothetical protein
MALEVTDCTACGGAHPPVRFERVPGPDRRFAGVCPATGREITMDTRANSGAWEGLMAAAGVTGE